MRPVTDTLRLIRLLDGALPAGEGAELREQLASDESLRHEWRRVNVALAKPTSIDGWVEVDPFDGAEQIAALIEGHAADEHDLADGDNVVHELASLDRRHRAADAADVHVPAAVRDRMAGVVLKHIQPTRTGRSSDQPRAISRPVRATSLAQPATAVRPAGRKPTRGRQGDQRRITFAVAAVAGIVLLSVICWRVMWNPAGPVRPDIDDVAEGTTDPNDSVQPSIDVPAHQNGTDDPPHQQPESSDAPSQLVHQAPDEVIEVEEDIIPRPPTPPATVVRHETLEWRQIVGIVVASDSESTGWRGALATAKLVDSTDAVAPPMTFRSLRESWGQAGTASGIDITLGEETLVSLAVEVADIQTVRANIERGLLAIGGLSREAVVQCETTSMPITLRSLADGSRIAFILSGDSTDVLVLAGEVAVGDLIVAAPAGIEWTSAGDARITSTVRPIDWLEAPARIPAEQEWLNVCLAEADIVSALLQADSGQSDRTLAAAVGWSIALDAPQAVPLAAASTESAYREAALAWLSDATHDADQRAAVWNSLRPLLAETELSVAHWFEIARGDADVTPEVLQELALGVGRSEPLFVRHAAIRYLREATGQRFASYDPESPTQSAVAEVRAFVRQITRPNMRQPRGRP